VLLDLLKCLIDLHQTPIHPRVETLFKCEAALRTPLGSQERRETAAWLGDLLVAGWLKLHEFVTLLEVVAPGALKTI
jgi:hypothetical protein